MRRRKRRRICASLTPVRSQMKAMRRVAKSSNRSTVCPNVVMGCYTAEEVNALPGVEEVVTDKRELPDWLGRFGVLDAPTGISGLSQRSRAYVKIQDGAYFAVATASFRLSAPKCTADRLTYCRRSSAWSIAAIEKSYSPESTSVITVSTLTKANPRGWVRLSHLVRQLVELEGDFRIRHQHPSH